MRARRAQIVQPFQLQLEHGRSPTSEIHVARGPRRIRRATPLTPRRALWEELEGRRRFGRLGAVRVPGCCAGPAIATIANGAGCVCGGVNLVRANGTVDRGVVCRANEATPDRAPPPRISMWRAASAPPRGSRDAGTIANRESDLGRARRPTRGVLDAAMRSHARSVCPRVRRERRGRAAAAAAPRG